MNLLAVPKVALGVVRIVMARLHMAANLVVVSILCLGLSVASASADDAEESGWFLGASAGPSFVNDMSLIGKVPRTPGPFAFYSTVTSRLSFNTGVRADRSAGYQFDNSWAVEAQTGYIRNSVEFIMPGRAASTALFQVPLLVNGIYTVPVKWRIKPYFGVGLGGVESGLEELHDLNGAGQLLAGVKCRLGSRIDVGLGYNFLITTKHSWDNFLDTTQTGRTINNSILANVTFRF